MTQQTVKQWFIEKLSPSDAEKAISYTPESVLESEIDEDPLQSSFYWHKTPEGHDYWNEIDKQINDLPS